MRDEHVHYGPEEYVKIIESFENTYKELYDEFRLISHKAVLGDCDSIQRLEDIIRDNPDIDDDFKQVMMNVYVICLDEYGGVHS